MKTDPSKSISFPQKEKDKYLALCDSAVKTFAEYGVMGFSAFVRKVLGGKIEVVDGKKAWVVELE